MRQIGKLLFSKKRWVIRKISQALLGTGLIILALVMWFQYESISTQEFHQTRYYNAQQVADLLAKQINAEALTAKTHLNLLNSMAQSELIEKVELADPAGLLIAQSEPSSEKVEKTTNNLDIVKPLYKQSGQLSGYLTLEVNTSLVSTAQQNWLSHTSSTVRLLFFIIALASLFISRAFFIAPGDI